MKNGGFPSFLKTSSIQIKKENFLQISPKFRYFSSSSKDRITHFAELVNKDLPKESGISEILNAVWNNPVVTSQCPDLVIRLTSLRGEVNFLLIFFGFSFLKFSTCEISFSLR